MRHPCQGPEEPHSRTLVYGNTLGGSSVGGRVSDSSGGHFSASGCCCRFLLYLYAYLVVVSVTFHDSFVNFYGLKTGLTNES